MGPPRPRTGEGWGEGLPSGLVTTSRRILRRMNRDFHEFERTGWTNPDVVEGYEAGFGRLTVNIIDTLLDAANVGAGTRLLDVATGPGYVAATAAERGAEVIA